MEYFLYEGDIRLEHPEITEDQTGDTFPVPDGYVFVTQEPMPEFDPSKQDAVMSQPFQKDGNWVTTWELVDLTPEQIQQREAMISEMNAKFQKEMEAKYGKQAGKQRPPTNVNGSPPNVI